MTAATGHLTQGFINCRILLFITARAYARAVLGVVILSVRLSVCLSVRLSHACIAAKLYGALQIFLYHTKGQSLCYSDTQSGRRRPLPFEICVESDPPPFEKRRLRPISAHNVSAVGDSEKVIIIIIIIIIIIVSK